VGAWLGLMLGVGLLLIWRSGARAPMRARRAVPWVARRAELLHRAGITDVAVVALLGIQVGCAVVVGLAVLVVTSTLAIAGCFAGFGFVVPIMVVRRMAVQRQGDLREQWPEAVDNLASAVRAGMALPEAVAQLARRGPAPLRAPFARFAAAYRSTGRFGQCLDLLKGELADPVGDRVCETLRVAREVGGSDLGTVLRTLSELLREDARTRAELETRQGWVVNGARLAVAAPWLVLLMLGTQSQTVEAYDTPTGALLLAIGAAACIAAYRMMLRIGRLPVEQRVLQQ
jgi:tight adherence protein B